MPSRFPAHHYLLRYVLLARIMRALSARHLVVLRRQAQMPTECSKPYVHRGVPVRECALCAGVAAVRGIRKKRSPPGNFTSRAWLQRSNHLPRAFPNAVGVVANGRTVTFC